MGVIRQDFYFIFPNSGLLQVVPRSHQHLTIYLSKNIYQQEIYLTCLIMSLLNHYNVILIIFDNSRVFLANQSLNGKTCRLICFLQIKA